MWHDLRSDELKKEIEEGKKAKRGVAQAIVDNPLGSEKMGFIYDDEKVELRTFAVEQLQADYEKEENLHHLSI